MLAIALTLALNASAHAGTVLLQGPHTSSIEYKAMLKAHPQLISPVQEYLNSHPLPANRERLLGLFSEAQKAFLEKSTEESTAKFKSLLALLSEDDWEESEREIFLQAYLRLAQMENNPEAKQRWLGQSLLVGAADFDADLYPPPLLAKRLEMEKHLPRKDIAKKLLTAGWTELLINGQACHRGACGDRVLYPGRTRITVLSDQWAPQTSVLDLAEIEHFRPKTEPWAEGDCGKSSLTQAGAAFPESKVFWGLNCEKQETPALNLKPAAAPLPEPLPLFTTAAPQAKPFYHSPWFWAGVTAVVIVAVVASSHTKETKEPSTTYGY